MSGASKLGRDLFQIGQRIRCRRVFGIYRGRWIPVALAAHGKHDSDRRFRYPFRNILPVCQFGGAESLFGGPIPVDFRSSIPIAMEGTEYYVIGQLEFTRPTSSGIVSQPHGDSIVFKQRIDELGQSGSVITGDIEAAKIVVIGHQLGGGPLSRIVVKTPDLGSVALALKPSSRFH